MLPQIKPTSLTALPAFTTLTTASTKSPGHSAGARTGLVNGYSTSA